MAEQHETNTQAEGGEELAKLIIERWRVNAGSGVFIDEVMHAHEVTGLSVDAFAAATKAVNERRGYDFAEDKLTHAWVPERNMQAVCNLLDQIQSLCEWW